jgi:hypothetical protein
MKINAVCKGWYKRQYSKQTGIDSVWINKSFLPQAQECKFLNITIIKQITMSITLTKYMPRGHYLIEHCKQLFAVTSRQGWCYHMSKWSSQFSFSSAEKEQFFIAHANMWSHTLQAVGRERKNIATRISLVSLTTELLWFLWNCAKLSLLCIIVLKTI